MPQYLAPCPHDKRGTEVPSPQGPCILGCLRSRTWINAKWSVVGCQARKHIWGCKPRHSPGYRTQASPGSWDAQRLTWALCDPVYYPTPNLHNPHWVVKVREGKEGDFPATNVVGGLWKQELRLPGQQVWLWKGRQWWSQLVAPKHHPKPQVHCLAQKLPQVQALGTAGRRSSCGYGSHVCTLNLCRSGRGWQGPRPARDANLSLHSGTSQV